MTAKRRKPMTGPQLRAIRLKQFRMTQQRFAEELGYASRLTISLMESGKQEIPKYVEMAVKWLAAHDGENALRYKVTPALRHVLEGAGIFLDFATSFDLVIIERKGERIA